MPKHTIAPAKFKVYIDAEVLAILTDNAGAWDRPNDVLRKLLKLEPNPKTAQQFK